MFNNIRNSELACLARSSFDENNGDISKTSNDLDAIDKMLGVLKMKSLVHSRERNAKSRWSRGRNLHVILGNILLSYASDNR